MDEKLLRKARLIVAFKIHRTIFMLGVAFLVLVDILLNLLFQFPVYWIIFPVGLWTIALIFHYFYAYKWDEKMLEQELEKLQGKQQNTNNHQTQSE